MQDDSSKIENQNDFLSPQGNTYKNEALSALVVLGIDKLGQQKHKVIKG